MLYYQIDYPYNNSIIYYLCYRLDMFYLLISELYFKKFQIIYINLHIFEFMGYMRKCVFDSLGAQSSHLPRSITEMILLFAFDIRIGRISCQYIFYPDLKNETLRIKNRGFSRKSESD